MRLFIMKKNKFIGLAFLTLLSFQSFASSCSDLTPAGVPQTEVKVQDICNTGYRVGYSYASKTPMWVSENLTRENLRTKNATRQNDFRPDPQIPSQYSATLSDFKNNGVMHLKGRSFDRGHMAPAEDFRGDPDQMSESFYLSNMVPQDSANNRGIWATLEKNVRGWANKYGEVYVVTGPVFPNGMSQGRMGKVYIPVSLYKAVYIPSLNQAVAFIIPNQDVSGSLQSYMKPVSEVESLTLIDVFPKVSSEVKSRVANVSVFNNNRSN